MVVSLKLSEQYHGSSHPASHCLWLWLSSMKTFGRKIQVTLEASVLLLGESRQEKPTNGYRIYCHGTQLVLSEILGMRKVFHVFIGAITILKNLENTCPFESIRIIMGIVNFDTCLSPTSPSAMKELQWQLIILFKFPDETCHLVRLLFLLHSGVKCSLFAPLKPERQD